MRVDIIDTSKGMKALQANWDAVYDADPEAHYFLSWHWMNRWRRRVAYRSLVLAARPDEDGAPYVAFMPIWIKTKERKTGDVYNVVHMAGNHFSDYTGLICRPEAVEQAVPALGDEIRNLRWSRLCLQDIRVSDPRLNLFMKGFRKQVFDIEQEKDELQEGINLNISPRVQLADSWDAYLEARLSANMRQKLRRLERQFEKSKDLSIVPANQDTLNRDIEALLRLWADRWGRKKGKRLQGILANNRAMLRHAFETGTLYLPVMWHGERPVGALSILIDHSKKTFLFFAGGRDQMFEGPSPGLLLHAHSIRHAIANGFTCYDFLRGDEPYKYSFGAEEQRIRTLFVRTRNKQNLGGMVDKHCLPVVIRRAVQNDRTGAKAKAEVGYRAILAVDPACAMAHYGLARIAAARGDLAAAGEHREALRAVLPDGYEVAFASARILQAEGRLAEAADAYAAGIERAPKSSDAYLDLGNVLRELRLYDLAIAAFEVVTELEPGFPRVDQAKIDAVKARDRQKSDEIMRVAAEAGAMSARIAKLKPIARVIDSKKPRADVPLVLEWQQKGPERPFTFSRSIMPTVGGKAPTTKT